MRLMPPKLQVALYYLVMRACLCLQVMFLLRQNSNSIRQPFLLQLYQEDLEPLLFFVLWTTSLGQLFLTFFHGLDTATHLLFLLVSVVLLATALPSVVTAIWLVIAPYWLRAGHLGQGWEPGLVAFHHCPALETSILLKPVKRHLRGDSSVKLQCCGQFSEFTCDSQKAETGERPFLASPQTPQAHQREFLGLIQYLPYCSFLLTSHRYLSSL